MYNNAIEFQWNICSHLYIRQSGFSSTVQDTIWLIIIFSQSNVEKMNSTICLPKLFGFALIFSQTWRWVCDCGLEFKEEVHPHLTLTPIRASIPTSTALHIIIELHSSYSHIRAHTRPNCKCSSFAFCWFWNSPNGNMLSFNFVLSPSWIPSNWVLAILKPVLHLIGPLYDF